MSQNVIFWGEIFRKCLNYHYTLQSKALCIINLLSRSLQTSPYLSCVCYDDIRLTAIFQYNLCKPVPECTRILAIIGAKDGGGGRDHWSYKTCKTLVKSSPLA